MPSLLFCLSCLCRPRSARSLNATTTATTSAALGLVTAFVLSSATCWSPATAATAGDTARAPVPGARALSLQDAERMALAHQPALLGARGQTEAAEGRVEQARSPNLPQISATAGYQRTTGNFAPRPGSLPTAATAGGWRSTTYDYFNLGAIGSQLIYDFGQSPGRWRAAGASRDAAASNERTVAAQTLLNVRRAYFQARAQRDLIEVAAETVRNQEKHLEQVQGFVRAGMRPEIDLAQARTDLANGRVQLVNATNNQALSLATLEQAIGVPLDAGVELEDADLPAPEGEDDSAESLVSKALHVRPEVTVIAHQQRAQELTLSALRGGYGPALSASAGATDTGISIDGLVPNVFVGLTLAWPLLQGGLTRGQIREARGTLATLVAQGDTVQLQIRTDVRQAQLAVNAAKSTIAASNEALTNAREQLRLAERRYETGLGSAIELGDAQVASTSAGAQAIGARYGLLVARAQLLAATGAP